ncbi:hypothetical protein [Methanobrevibacter sp.]
MVNEDGISLIEDIGVVLIGVLLLITIIPLILGVLMAFLVGASGVSYFTIVLGIAMVIWFVLGVMVYI